MEEEANVLTQDLPSTLVRESTTGPEAPLAETPTEAQQSQDDNVVHDDDDDVDDDEGVGEEVQDEEQIKPTDDPNPARLANESKNEETNHGRSQEEKDESSSPPLMENAPERGRTTDMSEELEGDAATAPSSDGEDNLNGDDGNTDSSVGDRRNDNDDWHPPKKRRRKTEPMKPFNDMLYELLAFRAREGHCRVPLDAKSALGRWVANLRTQKSNLRKGYQSLDLTQERLSVLDSVGFVWDLQQFDSDARWKRQFEELLAFKSEHGHCNVPQSTPLGKWVKMQRENYRETQLKASGQLPTGRSKPRPTLSQFRIEQLETLGFNWKVAAPAVGWEHRFEELLDYRRVHGDCNVPQAWQENRQLGRWVMKQRCQYTLRQKAEKNQLSDDRVARLEEIGFSWTAPSFRKKKEGPNEILTGVAGEGGGPPAPPLGGPHLLPPAGGHHVLPPHDFRRWGV